VEWRRTTTFARRNKALIFRKLTNISLPNYAQKNWKISFF